MARLIEDLATTVSDAFEAAGFDRSHGAVSASNRPDLGQFQCAGALAAAKAAGANPRDIATTVAGRLEDDAMIVSATVAGPGFINIVLDDDFLAGRVGEVSERLPDAAADSTADGGGQTIVIDYGGANIAKPLHVGHLRAAIIGEALKRLGRALGHTVIGDVHLGDWGLQMGMVISEIARRQPGLPYFDERHEGAYPADSPVGAADLEEVYPAAAARCRENEADLAEAREITRKLQEGHRGYRALWQHIHDVSVADLREDYRKLDIDFDLWLGESDTASRIPALVARLSSAGHAVRSEGALVMFVNEPEDRKELPPLILEKSDGAALYGTTDLATIEQRMEEIEPDLILYVVDKRQSDHFVQVFRAARLAGIAPADTVALEHLGFGTMNGPDRRPFKTREGGVMKLKDLIAMLEAKALERMSEVEVARAYDEQERREIARMVGVAALKFGDLANQPATDYILDLDRFASFEGKTGPYLLYAAVRIKSILRKAAERGLGAGSLLPAQSDAERSVMLTLAQLPDRLARAFDQRAPNQLCDYAYELASQFSAFYRDHHILNETDAARRASWLGLADATLRALELVVHTLGFEIPERM